MTEAVKFKKYRFFYHYNRANKKISVHFRGKCYIFKDMECKVKTESKWNKSQPYLVMQGYCTDLLIEEDKITIY